MRFQELRDISGALLVQGLHPAISVVAANPAQRAAALAALEVAGGCRIVRTSDIDGELARATMAAASKHDADVEGKRGDVAAAERSVAETAGAAERALHGASAAAADLARFGELADRLASVEEGYQAAVRAEAEAARSLAATLGELDHVLEQRRVASASLDQARSSRDNRGVPEPVVQQAVSVQAALASAESAKSQAVEQADEMYQGARAATREALESLHSAHRALDEGLASVSSDRPEWGSGIPLPGLVANYRDHLAARLSVAQEAERQAREAEVAARERLGSDQRELASLVEAGAAQPDPLEVALEWVKAQQLPRDEAVAADDAFSRFGPEGVTALVTTFSAHGCQVIYMTEDSSVLAWAIGLPSEAGAAKTIAGTRPRPRSYALLGG